MVEKCTPQQARIDFKGKSKLVTKPKIKPVKVTVPTVADTDDIENVNNFVLFLALILGKLPKMTDQKLKLNIWHNYLLNCLILDLMLSKYWTIIFHCINVLISRTYICQIYIFNFSSAFISKCMLIIFILTMTASINIVHWNCQGFNARGWEYILSMSKQNKYLISYVYRKPFSLSKWYCL